MNAAAPDGLDEFAADTSWSEREYAGEHAVCHMTLDRTVRDMRAAIENERQLRDADAAIGRAVRRMVWPGVKRRQYRRDELQALVDAADRRFGREVAS
jgi:hypothetical protein